MKGKALLLFLLGLLSVQLRGQVTITISHQPYESFKGAFGSGLRGVGLYQATVCNDSTLAQELSEGRIVQVIEQRVAVLNPALVLPTAARARSGSKMAKFTRAIEFAALGASLYLSTGKGRVNSRANFLVLAGSGVSGQLHEWAAKEQRLPEGALVSLLDTARKLILPAGACSSRLALGAYRKSFDPYQVTLR